MKKIDFVTYEKNEIYIKENIDANENNLKAIIRGCFLRFWFN